MQPNLYSLSSSISDFFTRILGPEFGVLIISMFPIIELRGAIPVAFALKIPMIPAFFISVIGNLIPIPFILLFIQFILEWMRNYKIFQKPLAVVDRKIEKITNKYQNLSFWALVIFVAIPLPGTGAWTGALAATLFKINFFKAMLAITIGVLIAGIVITALMYGGFGFLLGLK